MAAIDYPGYNGTKHSKTLLKIYRVTHGFLVFGLGLDLYIRHGFYAGFYAPFLFWYGCWKFNNDWLYYIIAFVLNPKNKPFADEGRKTAVHYFTTDSVGHAWWTPLGLFYNLRDYEMPFELREKPSAQALWAQSAFSLIIIIFVSLAL